jgi:hypothetical protein
MIGRSVGTVLLIVVIACPFAACATGTDDSSGGTVSDAAPSNTPDTAPSTSPTDQPDGARPQPDTGTNVDSSTPNPYADSGLSYDGASFDVNVSDVTIPDVYVPPGTTACNYFGDNGADLAKYIAECAVFESVAVTCAGGCPSGSCCAALCTNSSNAPLCLPTF